MKQGMRYSVKGKEKGGKLRDKYTNPEKAKQRNEITKKEKNEKLGKKRT